MSVILAGALILMAPPGPAAPPPPETELAAICRAFRETDHPFNRERRVRAIREALPALPEDDPRRVQMRGLLGRELILAGRPEEAIAELTPVLAEARKRGGSAPVAWVELHLGLAWLQRAEDAQCRERGVGASCILPFRPEALHGDPEPARRAAAAFLASLEADPEQITARWLLQLAHQLSGGTPGELPERFRQPAGWLAAGGPFPRWPNLGPELGLDRRLDLAGGAVIDDFDGDGFLDLVASTWDPCVGLIAWRNDGQGGFEEASERWGLAGQLGGLNLIHGDYDGDGRLDLLVLRGGWLHETGRMRRSLLRNEIDPRTGTGGFRDLTRAAGLAEPAFPSQTAAFADYDGDGDLDLYVGNEAAAEGAAYPSQLFRNRGDGTFEEVAAAAGVTNDRYAKGVAWGDYDDDGDPDLYVSNLGPNRLYRNDGDGSFTDVAPALGVTEPDGRSFASWFFDPDGDGDLDLFVAAYDAGPAAVQAWYMGRRDLPDVGRARLYLNGGGRFTEVGREWGLGRPLMPMGANYGDLDGDGWLDVYLGTGTPEYESVVPNVLLHNVAREDGGRRFEDATFAAGLGHLQKGHGVAFGDLDHDGDLDLFHQLGGFFPGDAFGNALFVNPGPSGRSLTLLLEGRKANRSGIGARIEVRVRQGETVRSIHRVVGTGGSFGGSTLRQQIGLGEATAIDGVVVRWPGSGTVQVLDDLELDRAYRVVEGEAAARPLTLPRLVFPAEGERGPQS
ncbi:MAG TPA: CRTAC1 family protein [Thermoanaerobaculia bacterium]|nr:CRTAC1 family protein [Thermoanaerobaculia bacterium]